MNENYVDLHIHTTCSDGSESSDAVVKRAFNIGLSAVAITDHDSVKGVSGAVEEARKYAIEVVSGVELTGTYACGSGGAETTAHIVGLFINATHHALNEYLDDLRQMYAEKYKLQIELIKRYGYNDISYEELIGHTRNERPHVRAVANYLIKKNVVRDFDEARQRFLSRGNENRAPSVRYATVETCVSLIKDAGGQAIWAHPLNALPPDASEEDVTQIGAMFKAFRAYGIDGIETYHYSNTRERLGKLNIFDWVRQYGLLESGGSDYHGEDGSGRNLGFAQDGKRVPYGVLERLKQARCMVCN